MVHGVEITQRPEYILAAFGKTFDVFGDFPGTGALDEHPAFPGTITGNRRHAERDIVVLRRHNHAGAAALAGTDHRHARSLDFRQLHGEFNYRHLIGESMIKIIIFRRLIQVEIGE